MWHLNHSACSKIQYPPPEILKKNGSLFWPLRSWRLFELINQFAPIDYVHQGRLPSISLAREALFSRFVCLLFLFDAILHSLRARLIGDLAPLLNLFINSSAGGLFLIFFFSPTPFRTIRLDLSARSSSLSAHWPLINGLWRFSFEKIKRQIWTFPLSHFNFLIL